MTQCWSEGALRAYLDRELPPEDIQRAAAHLKECTACDGLCKELAARAARVAELVESLPELEAETLHVPVRMPVRMPRRAGGGPRIGWVGAAVALAAGLGSGGVSGSGEAGWAGGGDGAITGSGSGTGEHGGRRSGAATRDRGPAGAESSARQQAGRSVRGRVRGARRRAIRIGCDCADGGDAGQGAGGYCFWTGRTAAGVPAGEGKRAEILKLRQGDRT